MVFLNVLNPALNLSAAPNPCRARSSSRQPQGGRVTAQCRRATRESQTGLAVGDHLGRVVLAGSARSADDERLPGRAHRILPRRLVSEEAAAASPHRRSPSRAARGGRDRWRGGRPWVVASVLILPAGRRGGEGEGEEEEGFCSFARDETEFGQAWNLGCFAYPVRLNLETISPTGFDLGSVGFELRKHRKVKELS